MSKPLIGITTYVEPASWGHWNVQAALVPYEYVRAVERAGGRAVLVPPDEDGIEEVLDALDGLIFSGGNDMTPEEYGAEPHPETTGTNPARDPRRVLGAHGSCRSIVAYRRSSRRRQVTPPPGHRPDRRRPP
jgi:gamma-glutamyl-gamma-aminobutyrate hydrolase PuuD